MNGELEGIWMNSSVLSYSEVATFRISTGESYILSEIIRGFLQCHLQTPGLYL